MLAMTQSKQVYFLTRILFLHGRTKKNDRLQPAEWNLECDQMCLLFSILEEMKAATDPARNNAPLFADDVVRKLTERGVEG